ncbi:MAG: HPF/RaiA family ribosome-associated protein [Bacteriovoracales bacterium]|jgi:ribosomal subunit interface protein
MELVVNYHQMDRSEALDGLLKTKSEKLLQKFKMKGKVIWTFEREHNDFSAEVHYHYHGHDFHAHSTFEDPYKTIEPNLHKLEKQLKKHLTRDRIHEA